MATGSAAADTVVVIPQSCSSASNPVIAVTQQGRAVRSAHLDIYREIERGERPAWGGLTDKHGVAKPPDLPPGKYRVVADSGKMRATKFLTISSDDGTASRCEIKLTPPDPPRVFGSPPEQIASIRVLEFRGVIEDPTGAVLPNTKIRVLRKSSDKADLADIQSDGNGQFSLHLDRGTYLAVFSIPSFKTQVVSLKISKHGWHAVKLTMELGATYVPPEKWDWSK
jgi:hypothetical protein